MSDNETVIGLISILSIFVAFFVIIFSISSCSERQNSITKELSSKCISSGGTVIPSLRDFTITCVINKGVENNK